MKHFFLVTSMLFTFLLVSPLTVAAPMAIVGTWKLLKMERQNEKDQWEPRCFAPTGLITYTDQGYMAVGINCMLAEGSVEPSMDIKDTVFYTGTYQVVGEKVVHQIQNSSSSVFYGKNFERSFKFSGKNRVELIGKGINGKLVKLVWEKVSK